MAMRYKAAIGVGDNPGIEPAFGETLYSPLGTPDTAIHDASSVELSDGRVLVVWADGDKIKQGYLANIDAVFSDYAVGSVTTILSELSGPWCLMSKIDAGLFLAINYEQKNSDLTSKSLLYKSPSGEGGDWILYSTIDSANLSGYTIFYHTCGTRLHKSGNRYLLATTYSYLHFGAADWRIGIFESTDLINWTVKYTFTPTNIVSHCITGCSSSFIEINGNTYWSWSHSWSGGKFYLARSSDGFDSDIVYCYTASIFSDVPGADGVLHYDSENERLLIIFSREYTGKGMRMSGFDVGEIGVDEKYQTYASNTEYDPGDEGAALDIYSDGRCAFWAEGQVVLANATLGTWVRVRGCRVMGVSI